MSGNQPDRQGLNLPATGFLAQGLERRHRQLPGAADIDRAQESDEDRHCKPYCSKVRPPIYAAIVDLKRAASALSL
jgi:hypothetical protein